jgi:hypothetical protein
MVNELGNIASLHVAMPRDVVPFPTGAPSRGRAAVENTQQASAGQPDRPGFSALFAQFRASGEQRAEAAVQLRQFQTSLQRADEVLTAIRKQLGRIVKQYPPFNLDDPQRIAYLNAIPGLRKQLDALTFPPERQQQDQPSSAVDGHGKVPAIPANPLQGDLAIPDLDPRLASDAEVRTALDAATKVLAQVREVQDRMWQDVVRFVGGANLGPDGDASAQTRAVEVQRSIAAYPGRGGIGVSLQAILSIGQ